MHGFCPHRTVAEGLVRDRVGNGWLHNYRGKWSLCLVGGVLINHSGLRGRTKNLVRQRANNKRGNPIARNIRVWAIKITMSPVSPSIRKSRCGCHGG
jgi:hypothetical protein